MSVVNDSTTVWLDKKALRRRVGTHSDIARLIADRLISRLNDIHLAPRRILEMGGPDSTRYQLTEYFSSAEIIVTHRTFQTAVTAVSDYEALPFNDRSIDFIFSNLVLHHTFDPKTVLKECYRVLKPGGLMLFTTLGPDTLKELRRCFSSVDSHLHVHPFTDMHHIGDMLVNEGYLNPVVDMEHLTIHYDSVNSLMQELKNSGGSNALLKRSKGLMGRKAFQHMLFEYEKLKNSDNHYPATVEVIYGHAWRNPIDQHEVLIPVSEINLLR